MTMSDVPAADGPEVGAEELGDPRFVTAVVTVPADSLASFYQAVADWWEREGRVARGRIIR
jgi:hypothetical protein